MFKLSVIAKHYVFSVQLMRISIFIAITFATPDHFCSLNSLACFGMYVHWCRHRQHKYWFWTIDLEI